MTMEDSDLRQRLRLAREKIAMLQMEVEELTDMRDLLREILRQIEGTVELRLYQRRQRQKKSPAERRAEMTRLWAAERNKS